MDVATEANRIVARILADHALTSRSEPLSQWPGGNPFCAPDVQCVTADLRLFGVSEWDR